MILLQDIFGKRGYLAVLCAVLTIPVFGILAFTSWYPLIATLWLGITYSFAAVSIIECREGRHVSDARRQLHWISCVDNYDHDQFNVVWELSFVGFVVHEDTF